MEAQQGLLKVPRAASTHKVLEGAVDALPAALHGKGTQTQLPAMEAVEGRSRDGAVVGRTQSRPLERRDIQPGQVREG